MVKFLFTNDKFQQKYIYHYFNVKFKGCSYDMIFLGMIFEKKDKFSVLFKHEKLAHHLQ
jgi:hypothetical protein